MFAQLGNHVFQGMKSPHAWGEASAVRYGKIPLINGKDILQYTGADLVEIDLSLRYSMEFCDPATEITALKKSMKRAEILPFISGEGDVIGNFVITGIDVANEMFFPTGRLEAATVSLKLMEYAYGKKIRAKAKRNIGSSGGIDNTAAAETLIEPEEEPAGEALESADPVPEPPAPAEVSPANDIAADISKAKEMVEKIKKKAADVKKGITTAKQAVREVRQLANRAKEVYTNVKTKVENTVKIIERASHLPTSLDEVIGYAENLSKIDNVADMSVIQSNIASLSESSANVTAASAKVVAFSATKEEGK
jgi:phage protein U